MARPFATLTSSDASTLNADHLPLVLHAVQGDCGVLHGHMARANPLFREGVSDLDVLVVFSGPHSYISPSWYPSKQDHGKAVPTWNYIKVHARGTLRFTTDESWLLSHLAQLTHQHEQKTAQPWTLSDAPRPI